MVRKQYVNESEIPSHLMLIDEKVRDKNKKSIILLRAALNREVLFIGLGDKMIDKMIDKMYKIECPKNECVIKQNETGDAYFVIESGKFIIIHRGHDKKDKVVGAAGPKSAFGEGSLLYSSPRGATLKAKEDAIVWALDAEEFIKIRQKYSKKKTKKSEKKVKWLKKTKLFSNFHIQDVADIADAVKPILYRKESEIISHGEDSTHFFIVYRGKCEAYVYDEHHKNKKKFAKYSSGDCFGEHGIVYKRNRECTVIATSDEVICYVLNALEFTKLVKSTQRKNVPKYDEVILNKKFNPQIKCKLSQLSHCGVLGVGTFAQVSLVEDTMTGNTYSLKKIRKNRIVDTNQHNHVLNELAVLSSLNSAFCIRLQATYQDELNVYFLMDAILGGELFYLLKFNKKFPEKTARFYAGCVIAAFEHIHSKNVIFRDLKPENLLVSSNGYLKLIDFGFSKTRNNSCTLCGTPEYLAPEVIQCLSQSFTADWWALGIFIYEMIIGRPPFQDDANVKMYEKILTAAVDFPVKPKMSRSGKDLITSLLRKHAHKRLGSGLCGTNDVKNHQWFSNFDWDGMIAQKIDPPYIPKIKNEKDISNFEYYPDEKVEETLIEDKNGKLFAWSQNF